MTVNLDDLKKFQTAFHELVDAQSGYQETCDSIVSTKRLDWSLIQDETADKIKSKQEEVDSLLDENKRLRERARRSNNSDRSAPKELVKELPDYIGVTFLFFVAVGILWAIFKGLEAASYFPIAFFVAALLFLIYFLTGFGILDYVKRISNIEKSENLLEEYSQNCSKLEHDRDVLRDADRRRRELVREEKLCELADKSVRQLEETELAMNTATELAKPAGLVSQKDWVLIDVIIELLETGRADTLKEALQLADTSTYRSQVLERFDQSLQLQGAQLQQLRANAARDAEHQREMLSTAQATYEQTIRTNNLNEYMNTILSDISYQTRRSNELQQESNKLLRG